VKTAIPLLALIVLAAIPSTAAEDTNNNLTIRIVRTESPIKLDGVLDEEIWSRIEPITDFRQREPGDGVPASERTEVRICYDGKHLYFGIRAYDSEPDKLIRSVYERDGNMGTDDSFLIAIDSNDDNRTGYSFEMNLLGARTDAEFGEMSSYNSDWDAIWDYRVRTDEEGYTIEAVIPFFILRFTPSDEVEMGLALMRRIRRKNETVLWPFVSRDFNVYSISRYNTITGLSGIERGKHLEIKPYLIAGYSQTPPEDSRKADAGLDVKWGLTPNFTMDLTANTDFAQVESDLLQVNLTRFSLFYPEKREFFLESADLFQMGLPQRSEVFFSRRIGLRGSDVVPIIGGARAYGLIGNTNIGLMTMQTDAISGVESENFTVARVKQNFMQRSYVGAIVTSRRGFEPEEDTTVGGDLKMIFGSNIMLSGYVARSGRRDVTEDNWAYTAGALQVTDKYYWEVRYDDIGARFDPGIGFVSRPDQRTFTLYGEYDPRPGWPGVKQISLGTLYRRIANHDGILETQVYNPTFWLLFDTDDRITVFYEDTYDFVPWSFFMAPDVPVPSGEYKNRTFYGELTTSKSRRLAVAAYGLGGSYYGGDIASGYMIVWYKPTTWLQLRIEDQHDRVELPGGSFDSNISRFFISYYLGPAISTRIAAQYSSLYEDFVFNFRLRWIYRPGSEAWLVYNEGRRFDLPVDSLRDRALILKIVYNFNF
jgi:hypothetical protein